MEKNIYEPMDFSSIHLPIPESVKKYSLEIQKEIFTYLQEMEEHDKIAYSIAFNHLGTSFHIYKSNGFKEWSNKKITKQI
jgi:hypothetical protein